MSGITSSNGIEAVGIFWLVVILIVVIISVVSIVTPTKEGGGRMLFDEGKIPIHELSC